ncbi:MAG: FAD-dependent oxidoreductase [Flavobacterium sp.]|nr:MAG: FAD-dependent oxidoreductase [Flavobacterium sp.]
MENANLPDNIKSIWRSFADKTFFPNLESDAKADVAIIGGGITGVTTALLLKEAGYDVVLVEAMKVGAGNTGHSTGNLYIAVEEGFDTIQSKYDTETLKTVISARAEAMALIEQNVARFNIDCDLHKRSWYCYSANEENCNKIEKIYNAARDAGVAITEIAQGELPFPVAKGVKIDNQAQFNPLAYTQQLAVAIDGESCRIYENSPVTAIEEQDGMQFVRTPQGSVSAKYLVHATHTPKGVFLDFHSLLGTYREYGIAAKLNSGDYPDGTFWGYYNNNERFSVRTYEHEGEKRIIVVGQPHEVGQKRDNNENIARLEEFLHQHFDVREVTNRWGGQHYKSADVLPYIGRRSADSNVLVATGFSTDGLTYGTLSAMIIRDELFEKETEYTKLFSAARHNPLKAAGNVIKENAINAVELIKGYVFKHGNAQDVAAGEGKVIDSDGRKLAVYREEGGDLRACSAICTHLGCVVSWNSAEKTWDCPCHASRFDVDGCIIEGPALIPLEKVEVEGK